MKRIDEIDLDELVVISEDGVELKHGDQIFRVCKKSLEIKKSFFYSIDLYIDEPIFSSLERAEEWLMFNPNI